MTHSPATQSSLRTVRMIRAWLLVLVTLLFVIAPFFAKSFRGYAPEDFPNPITDLPVQPAGWAFSIWSVIYLGLLLMAIFGAVKQAQNEDWDRTRLPMIISIGLGVSWLEVAQVAPIAATVQIFGMAASAIWAMTRLSQKSTLLLDGAIGLYAGWVTAASGVSLGVVLTGYGVLRPDAAAIVCLSLICIVAVVVTHESASSIDDCLMRLRVAHGVHEIRVVDNASSDETAALLALTDRMLWVTALVAAPVLIHFMPLSRIIPLLVLLDFVAAFGNLLPSRRDVVRGELMRLLPEGFEAIGMGSAELDIADAYAIPAEAPYRFNRSFDMQVGYRTMSLLAIPSASRSAIRFGFTKGCSVLRYCGRQCGSCNSGGTAAKPSTKASKLTNPVPPRSCRLAKVFHAGLRRAITLFR